MPNILKQKIDTLKSDKLDTQTNKILELLESSLNRATPILLTIGIFLAGVFTVNVSEAKASQQSQDIAQNRVESQKENGELTQKAIGYLEVLRMYLKPDRKYFQVTDLGNGQAYVQINTKLRDVNFPIPNTNKYIGKEELAKIAKFLTSPDFKKNINHSAIQQLVDTKQLAKEQKDLYKNTEEMNSPEFKDLINQISKNTIVVKNKLEIKGSGLDLSAIIPIPTGKGFISNAHVKTDVSNPVEYITSSYNYSIKDPIKFLFKDKDGRWIDVQIIVSKQYIEEVGGKKAFFDILVQTGLFPDDSDEAYRLLQNSAGLASTLLNVDLGNAVNNRNVPLRTYPGIPDSSSIEVKRNFYPQGGETANYFPFVIPTTGSDLNRVEEWGTYPEFLGPGNSGSPMVALGSNGRSILVLESGGLDYNPKFTPSSEDLRTKRVFTDENGNSVLLEFKDPKLSASTTTIGKNGTPGSITNFGVFITTENLNNPFIYTPQNENKSQKNQGAIQTFVQPNQKKSVEINPKNIVKQYNNELIELSKKIDSEYEKQGPKNPLPIKQNDNEKENTIKEDMGSSHESESTKIFQILFRGEWAMPYMSYPTNGVPLVAKENKSSESLFNEKTQQQMRNNLFKLVLDPDPETIEIINQLYIPKLFSKKISQSIKSEIMYFLSAHPDKAKQSFIDTIDKQTGEGKIEIINEINKTSNSTQILFSPSLNEI